MDWIVTVDYRLVKMDTLPHAGKRIPGSLRRAFARAGSLVLLAISAAPEAGAQSPFPPGPGPAPDDGRDTPGWIGQFTVLAVNAVIGGLTAGLRRHASGGEFDEGFTRGFLGGTVIYAGKRIAVEDMPGAGLAGRMVGGVGGSMIRNASEGRPALQYLVLPVGPLRVHLDRSGGSAPPDASVRVDLNNVVMAAYAMTRRELEFDPGASLSAGAPVFRAPGYLFGEEDADSALASGTVAESTIFLSEVSWRTREQDREIFAHERVHVLQRDQLFLTLADPAGRAILRRVPGLRRLDRYADIHFTGFIFPVLSLAFREYERRPWEMEAFYLSEHR